MPQSQSKPSFLTYVADLLFLMRLPLLIPVWTVLLLGWITGSTLERPFVQGVSTNLLWIVLTGFSLTVSSIYVVNQIRDVEGDRINGKLFILPDGHVSIPAAWTLAVLCALGGMTVSLLFLPAHFTILFATSLMLGIGYNLPPARLKDRPIGGTIANFAGHGVMTYLAGYWAMQLATGTPFYWHVGLVAALSAGFANAAVYLISTVPDAEGDRTTGKRTFAVVYGTRATAWAGAVCCIASLGTAFLIPVNAWVMIVPAAMMTPLFLFFAFRSDRAFSFGTFRIPVVVLSASVALFVPTYALVVALTLFVSRVYYKRRFNYEYPSFKAH